MQVEHKGDWLYIYSGREFKFENPDMTAVGKEDPFERVQAIKVSSITSIKVDYVFRNQQIILYTPSVVILEFGRRNCHRINCFYEALSIVTEALGLDRDQFMDLARRGEETANSVQRGDEIND